MGLGTNWPLPTSKTGGRLVRADSGQPNRSLIAPPKEEGSTHEWADTPDTTRRGAVHNGLRRDALANLIIRKDEIKPKQNSSNTRTNPK